MKWLWRKKPATTPPSKPERIYSDQELKRIQENESALATIKTELGSWPKETDMVKILLGGKVGQVITSYTPPPERWNAHSWTMTGDRVTDSDSELFAYRAILAEEKLGRRYEIRLKSGVVVGNLRYWEIRRIAPPS